MVLYLISIQPESNSDTYTVKKLLETVKLCAELLKYIHLQFDYYVLIYSILIVLSSAVC